MSDSRFGFCVGGFKHGEAIVTPKDAERVLFVRGDDEETYYCDDASSPITNPLEDDIVLYTRMMVKLHTKDAQQVYVWVCGAEVVDYLNGIEGLIQLTKETSMVELCQMYFEEQYEQVNNEKREP